MAGITDYLENAIINLMRSVAFTEVAAYVALWVGDPLDTGAGGAEVSGGSYARQLAGLSAPSPAGVTSNAADITFPTATADWGTVTHVALMDAVSGGNMLMHSALDASKAVDDGDTFKILAGELDVTIE